MKRSCVPVAPVMYQLLSGQEMTILLRDVLQAQ